VRPKLRFLTDDLIEQIITEARTLLCKLGVEIHNDAVLSMLSDHGARIDNSNKRAFFTQEIIDKSLATTPDSFKLYDSLGKEAVDLSEYNVNFTPGSAAINILDADATLPRKPVATDYARYTRLMTGMNHIASQATAMIPALDKTRYIRAYAGVRPLVSSPSSGDDRNVSRGFALLDHSEEDLENFITISGGKLTTYRTMAEPSTWPAGWRVIRTFSTEVVLP